MGRTEWHSHRTDTPAWAVRADTHTHTTKEGYLNDSHPYKHYTWMKWQTHWLKDANRNVFAHTQTHSHVSTFKVNAELRSLIRDEKDVHITKSQLLKIVLPFHLPLSLCNGTPPPLPKRAVTKHPCHFPWQWLPHTRTTVTQRDQFLLLFEMKQSVWCDESWLV